MKRLRCWLGWHRWWFPYNPKGQSLPPSERVCRVCGVRDAVDIERKFREYIAG